MFQIGNHRIDPRALAFFATFLMVAALTFSRALLSISTGMLIVALAWHLWESKGVRDWRSHRMALVTGLMFFLPLLSFFWTSDLLSLKQDLQSKLSFVFIPLAFSILPVFSRKQYLAIFSIFSLTLLVVSLLTIGRYLLDFENLNLRVAQNSSIIIVTGINHIYFGYILAFSILLTFHLFLIKAELFGKKDPYFFLILSLISLVSLHVLTSRTGILAFYGGAMAYLLYYVVREKAYLKGLLTLALLLTLPVLSYQLFPSFQNRYDVTIWDAQKSAQIEGVDLNNHSVGLRFFTWKTSWEIFLDHPVLGVGIADLEGELFARYESKGLDAKRNLWLSSCHNQYLEYLSGLGIVGLVLLVTVLFYPLFLTRQRPGILLFCFIALTATAMLPESILERQIGIAFYTTFLFLIFRWEEAGN